MNRIASFALIAGSALLAGCATTNDTRYAAQPGVYADGYYVPAQDGRGDYYYDNPQTVDIYGAWSVGYGFGNTWSGPGFGPLYGWGWGGWGWGPWGYVGYAPWHGGWPGHWHRPPYTGPVTRNAAGPVSINRPPHQVVQLQSRSDEPPSRAGRAAGMERPSRPQRANQEMRRESGRPRP